MRLKITIWCLFFTLATLCPYPANSDEATSAGNTHSYHDSDEDESLSIYPDLNIVINIPAMRLTVYNEDDPIKTYSIAVGQKIWPTPEMSGYNMQQIEWNPWWYPPDQPWAVDEVDTPPGPLNPLGLVKLPIAGGILVHGTSSPKSIGRAASHGCIRMLNEDAVELAWFLQSQLTYKNTYSYLQKYQENPTETYKVVLGKSVPVEIIYEPIEVHGKTIILHKDVYKKVPDPEEALFQTLTNAGYKIEDLDFGKLFMIIHDWKETSQEVFMDCLLVYSGEGCDYS
ncbi:L,D-transpeptidase [bacterium]|nr:L,D-transpeptidase [bacterium]